MSITRIIRVLSVVILGGLLQPVIAHAYPETHESHYVLPDDLAPQLLPPPPAEGSPAWKEEIKAVVKAQKKLSTQDIAAIHDEQHLKLELVTSVMGPDFTPTKFPHTFKLLGNVFTDTEIVTGADKNFWHTRRPYLTDKRVKLMVDPIDQNPSYPSGHAAASRVAAEVLGMLYPHRLEELRARAEAIAYHRVEAGVHYPNDIEAGRMVAMMVIGALSKSDGFKADLAVAREEVQPH